MRDSPLLTPRETEGYTRVFYRTLEGMRRNGTGPAFVKLGRRVYYRKEDLDAWIESRRKHNTHQREGGR